LPSLFKDSILRCVSSANNLGFWDEVFFFMELALSQRAR
jgi:hypothetical protein